MLLSLSLFLARTGCCAAHAGVWILCALLFFPLSLSHSLYTRLKPPLLFIPHPRGLFLKGPNPMNITFITRYRHWHNEIWAVFALRRMHLAPSEGLCNTQRSQQMHYIPSWLWWMRALAIFPLRVWIIWWTGRATEDEAVNQYTFPMEGVNGLQFSIVCVGRIWREQFGPSCCAPYTLLVVVLTNLLRNETNITP